GGNRSDAGGRTPRPQGAPANDAAQAGPVDPRGSAPDQGTGEPPRTFGTITFDSKGNATGGGVGPGPSKAGPDNTTVAALPATDDPEELYQISYQFILSGDYKTAEMGFRDLIDRFPGNQREADARFWLGEAVLGQNRYRDAAQIF